MKRVFPILAVLTGVLLSYALYQALVAAPTEQTMGDVQRIFYYHVPSAWTAFILFFINFFASVAYLIWRNPKADMVALVTAAVGVPLVYFSIWFFRTQHPQPVVGGGGSLDPRMLHALLINWLAFSCFAALVCWSRYRLEALRREVDETMALEALLEPRAPQTKTSRSGIAG